MKIGYFENEQAELSTVVPTDPVMPGVSSVEQPPAMDVIIPEQDIDPETGAVITMRDAEYVPLSVDDYAPIVATLEENMFQAQQMEQQMNLLQDTFDTIKGTEEVSPAQVRAIGVQLSMIDNFIPDEDKIVRDANIGAVSEDGAKNLEITQEAMSASMKLIVPLVAALGVMLGALYFFLRSKRVADTQESHNDKVFKAMHDHADAAVKVSEELGSRTPLGRAASGSFLTPEEAQAAGQQFANGKGGDAAKLAARLARESERGRQAFNRFNFYAPAVLTKTDFANAATAYASYGYLGDISEELAKNIQGALDKATRALTAGKVNPEEAGKISAMVNEALKKAVDSIRKAGTRLDRAAASNLSVEGADLFSFPLFKNSTGPIVSVDGEGNVRIVSADSSDKAAVTTDMVMVDYISLLGKYREIPNATRKAEAAAKKRAEVGKQIGLISRKLTSGGSTDEERIGIMGISRALNNARGLISTLDRTWLGLCADASALTKVAHSSLAISKIVTTSEASVSPTTESLGLGDIEETEGHLDTTFESYAAGDYDLNRIVVTTEANAAMARVLVPLLIFLAVALGSLYAFMREKKIADAQRDRNRKIFEDLQKGQKNSRNFDSSAWAASFNEILRRNKEEADRILRDLDEQNAKIFKNKPHSSGGFKANPDRPQGAPSGFSEKHDHKPDPTAKSQSSIRPEVDRLKRLLASLNFQSETTIKKQDIASAIQNYQDYGDLNKISEGLGERLSKAMDLVKSKLSNEGLPKEVAEEIMQDLIKANASVGDQVKNVGRTVNGSAAKGFIAGPDHLDGGSQFVIFPLFRNSVSAVIQVTTKGTIAYREGSSDGKEHSVGVEMTPADFLSMKSNYEVLPKVTEQAEYLAQKRARIGIEMSQLSQKLKKHPAFEQEGNPLRGIAQTLNESAAAIRAIDRTWLKLCGDANKLIEIMNLTRLAANKSQRAEDLKSVDRVN